MFNNIAQQGGALAGLILATSMAAFPASGQDGTLLLRGPDIAGEHIAFIYAGDIWVAGLNGANPRRLTSSLTGERNIKFSPDGSKIAFSAGYDNNVDVYTINVAGGQPKRLTFHPGSDWVSGWTPDGSAVTFRSARENTFGRAGQLYHARADGLGLPVKQMETRFYDGEWSADGQQLAYISGGPAYNALYGGSSGWRQYRGGATPSVNIFNPKAKSVEYIPGERVNDLNPMWVEGKVWFISDRDNQSLNLFSYDPVSKAITQQTNEAPWDIRTAGTDGSRIIYEVGGRLKVLDARNGASSDISVSIKPDLDEVRPKWKSVSRYIEHVELSPTAKRALITARGEVFTIPLEDGSTRNLTQTSGVREFTALWSPKGEQIAYMDDKDGSYQLVLKDQRGGDGERRLALGPNGNNAFYTLLNWGGKGEHIVYQDNHLNLYSISITDGSIAKIATHTRRAGFNPAISNDGAWLAYTLEQPNYLADLMLYNFATGKSSKLSDSMSDTGSPAFSPDGKYLFFTASTNSGPGKVGLNMNTQEQPYRAGIYAVVLQADGKSPLLPKTGDEEGKTDEKEDPESEKKKENKKKDSGEKSATTKIDLAGIRDRIVALPVAERNYDSLNVAEDGSLYYIERVQPGDSVEPPGQSTQAGNKLNRFDFEEKETKSLINEVRNYTMSADGTHFVIRNTKGLVTAKVGEKLKPEPLKQGGLRAYIDPRQEWQQIFEEVWRMERDYFYAPDMHGLDWQAIHDRYKPLLAHVGRRADLNDLLREMIGEMQVGHNRTGGGDGYRSSVNANTGLLGANLRVENGHYRIKKIFTGENWNPFLHAPLAAPGLGVKEGDYILALNGIPLGPQDNIFAALEGMSDTQLTLSISSTGEAKDAKDIIVEPVDSERAIRHWNWVETNRKWVDAQSDGKVGYVYLPNTAGDGYAYFNRMMFAQSDREGMIFDERSNGGGQAADYIIDVLRRIYLSGWKDRDGAVFNTPGPAIYGPKVMLIDQDAGSGGDYMPYAFRYAKLGKLIGTRTWGGLIGISANPRLIDGGFLTVPFFRYFTPEGQWRIENEGVAPDIEVKLDPLAFNDGQDVQLQRALQEVIQELETYQPVDRKTPPPDPTQIGQ